MAKRIPLFWTLAAVLVCPLCTAAPAPKHPAVKPAPSKRKAVPAVQKTAVPLPAGAAVQPSATPPAEAAPAPETHTWALLVGVSKYQNPAIQSLRYPAADATAVRDALVDPTLGRIDPAHVRLLTDDQATSSSILGAVDDFLKPNVKPGDKVILFLAGHGVAKGVGVDAKGYFLGTDVRGASTAMLDASAVSLRALSAKLETLPASQFIVFVDACREDPTPGRGIKGNPLSDVLSRGIEIVPQDTTRPASAASFFACSIGQRAFEDPTLDHGVFTYWILDGIRAAAVPRKPDGAVDMGVLAGYVRDKVVEWAKNTSAKGDFEVEQTPEFVTSQLADPIVLIHVSRPLTGTPISPGQPELTVETDPPGAKVSVDGEMIGAGPVTKSLPKAGSYTVKVDAPGFGSVERTVTALDGYELQLPMSLKPGDGGSGGSVGSRTVTEPAESGAADRFRSAVTAEARRQWEIADATYETVTKDDPKFAPAYERLAGLRLRRGRIAEAIGTLMGLVAQVPSAHSYSLLSLAYSQFAAKEGTSGTGKPKEEKSKRGGLFGGLLKKRDTSGGDEATNRATLAVPKNGTEAAGFARTTAQEAVKLDSASAEAQAALGLAQTVSDQDGKNKDDALAAFGKAAAADPKNPAYQFLMGYGIRRFAQGIKDDSDRKSELGRAVAALRAALELRPNYYEAHRELAFCYHLMDDLPAAQREYELADANRGSATDENDVAAIDLSLSVIQAQEAAKEPDPAKKKQHADASNGYRSDATEITPDLTKALSILTGANLGSRITDYLPSDLQRLLNFNIQNEIRNRIRLPGGIHFP